MPSTLKPPRQKYHACHRRRIHLRNYNIKEKDDLPEHEVIKLPLSCFENMQLEWSWRTDELDNLIRKVYEGYEEIKAEYKISKHFKKHLP